MLKRAIIILRNFERVIKLMKQIKISTEFVTLGQFLKLANLIQTGGEAKFYLKENKVIVNGEEDNRRGRKLYSRNIVEVENQTFEIVKK